MVNSDSVREAFELEGRVAIITGGAGLLGRQHGETIAELGGLPILVDVHEEKVESVTSQINKKYDIDAISCVGDITSPEQVEKIREKIISRYGRIDILINNAANNPSPASVGSKDEEWSRLERFPLEKWIDDLSVGLTGAFICSKTFGPIMASAGKGVILNIGSDLGLIGPDQRLYQKDDLPRNEQPVKPISYSVVKTGLIGLTRYLATYWSDVGVRSNLIAPGGVYVDQHTEFVEKLTNLIPLQRMARPTEYKAAVAFLVSDASSYMTGAIVAVDGGRTCW